MSEHADHQRARDPGACTIAPGVLVGPYRVEGALGRGGSASVYVVTDTRTGRSSAMKVLHGVGDDERLRSRFRREFRALSRLLHPNVLRVEEWGLHDGRPWFTMERVEGEDLREAISRWSCLSGAARFARVHDVLLQITRALAYIHERGLVHRDVSPGNVMLRDDGVAKLMDFGLVTDPSAELTTVGEIVGTVAHTAPEQLRGEPVDARADLYALGTVLYQMLTGRKPFAAHTVQGWVDRHLNERPRPPSDLEPLVPELLERVCLRLLEKDPKNRFASAMHLLQVLGDTEGAVDGDAWPPRDIGRTTVKAWIRDAVEEVAAGRRGAALLLTGGSGSGKSRMLDLADRTARRMGVKVARARCRALDRPFGPIADLVQQLEPAWLPPAVAGTLAGGAGVPDERYPVIAGFREVVEAQTPCVLLVDQMERAAAATREAIEYLVRNTLELADAPVAYILTYEAEELEQARSVLGGLSALEREHLGPLDVSEVEELVLSVLPAGDAAELLARRLHAETGGSPAYVADVLHGLVDQGVIRREGRHWTLTLTPEAVDLPLPSKLRALLIDRIAPLGPDALEAGRTLAVARGPLELDVLIDATDLPEERIMSGLDELLDAAIVVERRRRDDDLVELSHARFRDVLLDGEDLASVALRHRRLGEVLEDAHRHALSDAFETLAWHFDQGGIPAKAYAYYTRTALAYLDRGLFEEGLDFVDRALDMEAEARPSLPLHEADRRLCELSNARCRALYHLGRWDQALPAGRRALVIAERLRAEDLLARAKTRVGYILRSTGRSQESERLLREALTHAEAADDATLLPRPLYHLGAVAWAQGDLQGAERCWTRALQVARAAGVRRAEGMAHNGLGILQASRGRTAEARRMLEVAADIFRDVGMVDYLAIVHVNLIELYLSLGMLRRALQLADKTVATAREVGHSLGTSLGLVWRARLQLVLGRPDEAEHTAAEALRIADEIGTLDEQVASLVTLVEARVHLGRAADALTEVTLVLDMLRDADHEGITAQAMALMVHVLVARGDPARARVILDAVPARSLAPHVDVLADLELAEAAHHLGDDLLARARLTSALGLAQRHGYRYFELRAHDLLARFGPDADRQDHAVRARALARTLAAGLARSDADDFLARGWGGDVTS